IEFLRNGYLIAVVELAAFDQHSLAFAKIDGRFVQMFQPCVIVALRKEEKEPLDLDVPAIDEKFLQSARTEICQALHDFVEVMEALVRRQFIEHFKNGALWG